MWPDRRLLDLLGIEVPIIQAPMAGAGGTDLAVAVSYAGGLGSLPCAMSNPQKVRADVGIIRQQTTKPLNLNFFCHQPSPGGAEKQQAWINKLAPYYEELGLDAEDVASAPARSPFDAAMCEVLEACAPEVVSFHFGLPEASLLARVKAAGCKVISSATTVAEARWLQEQGCDAIIAQGCEAGGHRGMFLTTDVSSQPGTFALLPQVVDAVSVPVIAAGGVGDSRGIAAAFALGAAGVQMGTAYLFTPEATISDLHRAALQGATDAQTALTNVFSGRPARGLINRIMREVGPLSELAPGFPTAGTALAPLKKAAEARGETHFSALWSGQAASLGQALGAADLTRQLAEDAQTRFRYLGQDGA